MHLSVLLLHLLPFLPLALAASKPKPKSKDAILLSRVSSLTLTSPGLTTARRAPAVPQLSCAGPACPFHTLATLRCVNAGSAYDAEDIQWTCTATLPPEFKLGSTDVQCEGYDGPDDDYVLRGSCAVTYRLLFTEKGEERYGAEAARMIEKEREGEESAWARYLFLALFAAVAGWIVYAAVTRGTDPRRGQARAGRRPGGGGGGGGGGWGPGGGGGGWRPNDDDNDAPPPYTPTPRPRYTKTAPTASSSRRSAGGSGWGFGRPGFWTGAAGGAAAGYAAGAASGARRGRDEGATRRSGAGSSDAGPSSSSGGSSGRTYESSGFGGTSRR